MAIKENVKRPALRRTLCSCADRAPSARPWTRLLTCISASASGGGRGREPCENARPGGIAAIGPNLLDIDHFQQINDRHGHAAGDSLLRAFAQRLRSSLRKTDMVARLGGDEFVVVLERMLEPKTAARLAAQTLKDIRRRFAFADPSASLSVTASIGIAFFDGGATSAGQLVAKADAMLYAAKKRGRDNFCIASWPHQALAIEATVH
jgi:diguanylate cyclase (GGDEF)-like protein